MPEAIASPPARSAVPDRHGVDLYATDPSLAALLRIYLPGDLVRHLEPVLGRLGADAGGRLDDLASRADKHPPTLSQRSRTGDDRQRIDKHPAYIALERTAFAELGLAAMSHRPGVLGWPERLPPLAKYALTYLLVQAEFGLCCPLSMTDSLTATLLRHGDPQLVARWLPGLLSQDLDQLTQGAMFMTEQGAGSDVSAVTTTARRDGDGDGDGWRLDGDKWFCSNPDAGLAMVLAHVAGAPDGMRGLGLFLMPRTLSDGTPNRYRIVRLKDKLGSRSMASGEIRLDGATAFLVGEIGRGFNHMATMVNLSRLSNGVRAAGLMRRALGEALFIANERRAFGRRLIEMPLMQRTLIKLMLPTEQARSMFMHTAMCLQRADAGEAGFDKLVRILTPLIKFRACRDARKVTQDAMEVRGGCGYIEEWSDPRTVRDALLGSIWEGTSNIVALDVLRSVRRDATLDALDAHLRQLLRAPGLPAASASLLERTLERTIALTRACTDHGADAEARRCASALYAIASAVVMAWEAAQSASDWRRLALAHLVLEHRLLPVDPLDQRRDHAAQATIAALLTEQPLDAASAARTLPHGATDRA